MQGTGTLSLLQNKKEYSEAEKITLDYFFTNLDKNIYALKPTLSFCLGAFLVGQYSRSHLSMRDRFLYLFDEMKKAAETGKIAKEDYISIDDFANELVKKGDTFQKLAYFEKRANSFLKQYGVDYGHASLKDADVIRFAIEGVSQLSTNVIEMPDPELGSYEEKSTRYIQFSKSSIIIPPRLKDSKYYERIKQNNDTLMESYEKNSSIVLEFLKQEVYDETKFKSKAAFERTAAAKTFDIMRYWLPQGLATSLGAIWQTRIIETHISQMLSHPLEELRIIGEALKEEGVKLSPGLLTHVSPNKYFGETTLDMYESFKDFSYERYFPIDYFKRVKLIRHTDDLENLLLASMLYEFSEASFETLYNKSKTLTESERDNIFEKYLAKRGEYDLMMKALKVGSFTFEFLIDIGAWRDVKRQRVGTILKQDITASLGYAYPEFLENTKELKTVKDEYDSLMLETPRLYEEVKSEFPFEAQYIPAMGHCTRFLYEFHPRQAQYVIELRTKSGGHHSYRTLFQDVFREVEKVIPRLAKYIKVDWKDSIEGRKNAEEKTAAKRGEK